jgi:hypothetical protein
LWRPVICTPWKRTGSSIVHIQTVISGYKWIQKGKYLERFIRWKVMGLIGWVSHHMIFARYSWARIKRACMGPSARFRLDSAATIVLCHHLYLISLYFLNFYDFHSIYLYFVTGLPFDLYIYIYIYMLLVCLLIYIYIYIYIYIVTGLLF